MVTLSEALNSAPEREHLAVFGALHEGDSTIVLLGPHEPGFWAAFSTSSEFQDGLADPLDRFSKRIIKKLAASWGGVAIFPSDGPPYAPFIGWAEQSGQAWASPVGMLVHARAGLMVSYRGAVRLPELLELPASAQNPCESCFEKPCLTACPVNALNASQIYDVPICKTHIARSEGAECLHGGCLVRRICPVSKSYGRLPEQSAFHMRAFL